jgi:hypothetical protein
MTPGNDLDGCVICRLLDHLHEDREDAIFRGDWAAGVALSDLIRLADPAAHQ